MTGFDFTMFERLYKLFVEFSDVAYHLFFIDTLRDVVLDGVLSGNSAYGHIIDDFLLQRLPENVLDTPIGFGLLFASLGFFITYTIVKWILDIVL